jgi:hypothetical protein
MLSDVSLIVRLTSVLLTDKWLNLLCKNCFDCVGKHFGFVFFACRYKNPIARPEYYRFSVEI